MADPSAKKPDDDALIPGQPIPKDAIDPELIALRRPAPRVGPLLSISIVVFCAYLMVALRHDLAFSREPDEPRQLTELASAYDRTDEFVSLRATADRAFAARVAAGEASEGGHRLAPVLGSSGKLWLYVEGISWSAPITYDEVHQGRVRALDDLPFADEVRAWVRAHPPEPRFVSAQALLAGVPARATAIDTLGGDRVEVAPDSRVVVAQIVPNRARITCYQTDDHPDEKTWRALLEQHGVTSPGQPMVASSDRSWSFEVDAPRGLPDFQEWLIAVRLFSVRVEPVQREQTATWGELTATADALQIGAHALPWPSLASVSVLVARQVPDDARVLITDEIPERYWYVLPVYALLLLFAALFSWALVRALRPDKPAAA